jgi:hypothetical protein
MNIEEFTRTKISKMKKRHGESRALSGTSEKTMNKQSDALRIFPILKLQKESKRKCLPMKQLLN